MSLVTTVLLAGIIVQSLSWISSTPSQLREVAIKSIATVLGFLLVGIILGFYVRMFRMVLSTLEAVSGIRANQVEPDRVP